MRKLDIRESIQKGSLMVEALALLGLITMVTPILYKKSAERTTELQDINTATQMRILSKAVEDYVKDHYHEVGGEFSEGEENLEFNDFDKLKEYLPYGFNFDQSKLFDQFKVGIIRKTVLDLNDLPHNIYTTAVLAPLKEKLSIMRSSKIASMIGANGGIYRKGNEESGTSSMLSGVQGTWKAPYSDYFGEGGETGLSDGSIVIISSEAISSSRGSASSEDALYRTSDGDESRNTMQTTLFMGGNPIKQVSSLVAIGEGAGTVEIGSGSKQDGLLVRGITELGNALTITSGGADITGDTKVDGALDVTGATTMRNKLTVTSGGADVTGDISLDNTTVDGTLKVAGVTTMENMLTVNNGGAKITGNTEIVGDLTVTGKAKFGEIEGTTIVATEAFKSGSDGAFTADSGGNVKAKSLQVDNNLEVNVEASVTKVLSATFNVNDNMIVTGESAYINNESFAVGGSEGTANNKININSDSAFIGTDYQTGGDTHEGLLIDASKIVLRNAGGSLKMSETDLVLLDNNKSRVKMEGEAVVIGVGDSGSEESKIVADTNKVGFESSHGSGSGSLYLNNNVLKFASGDNSLGILADEQGVAFGEDINVENSVDAEGGLSSNLITGDSSGRKVAISRKGIIEVAAPTGENDGFIRARRLVSDITYPQDAAYYGYNAAGVAPIKPYDYYQVNPAYTSVMNDIKLATRGGARLSDILPDFINKGIYIADNSYKDGLVDLPRIKRNGEPVSEVPPCDEADGNSCITSPWMGFIPAPQCPKNYAKVVLINPIKWKMAEVFSVYSEGLGEDPETYKDQLSSGFKTYFNQSRNPKLAGFELAEASSADAHTHNVATEQGIPYTFQINTFLNTTIEEAEAYDESNNLEGGHIGWHALMGFIYNPAEYSDLLHDISVEPNDDYLIWNLFPVYYGEMLASANVYCLFDRSATYNWWGNEVYPYDQINEPRFDYTKDEDWSKTVNDPMLGYDDAW